MFTETENWLQYNTVDFRQKGLKQITANVYAADGGILQVRQGDRLGPVIAEINIPAKDQWQLINTKLGRYASGIDNLCLIMKQGKEVAVDWVNFR